MSYNNQNKTYGDIFSSDFLELFGDEKEKISSIVLPQDEYKINLDEIIDVMNLEVEETFLDSFSGEFDSKERKIYINMFESEQRQRFTKSHEIGHCVLQHEGASKRNTNIPYSPKERAANQFAAELLMPPKLIIRAIEKYLSDENIGESELINLSQEQFVSSLSNSLGVSRQAMRYRLYNLGVITD